MSQPLPFPDAYFTDRLTELGRRLRDTVLRARHAKASLTGVARHSAADTIYELDAHVEPVLEQFCQDWSAELPLILIAEGAEGDGIEGQVTFPRGSDPSHALVRLIVDPIDGTRGLMYDKRSAWVLLGIAINKGPGTRLSDIQVAAQVEIPISKQCVSDVLWAVRGHGAHITRDELGSQHCTHDTPLPLRPSQATSLAHGFAGISNFFPGTKVLASELMERIVERTLGPAEVNKAMIFDDQYISTGGQFYELMTGHDRFNADLRPLFYRIRRQPAGLCVHPYDVANLLIAEEAGVKITDGQGRPLDGPLDVTSAIAWAGFANDHLRRQIEPVMLEFLKEKGI